MVVTESIKNYKETINIPLKNLLLFNEQDNNLYSAYGTILKTLKNPISNYIDNVVSDNTIYIIGNELFDKNTFIQNEVIIEQELNQSDWRVLEVKIKLYSIDNNIVPDIAYLDINGNTITFENYKIENDQIILNPIIMHTNKLVINLNWPIAYLVIECYI
jgi:hypothetical protein